MSGASRGTYRVRFSTGAADVSRAQALRALRFRGSGPAGDADAYDARALHGLVEESDGGRLVGCFRLLRIADGAGIAAAYSAQFYGLSRLARYPGPMLEVGRFCVAADAADPFVLRVAWGALADYVKAHRIGLVFGCSSFAGTQTAAYADAFALLRERHLAPARWLPRVKAPAVFRFARKLSGRVADPMAGLRAMPPLLRSYLAMGGWVSDHAVIDRDLGTLHVFTGLETGAVPPSRLRALRAVAV